MDNNELFLKGDKLYEEKKLRESFAVFMSAAKNGDVSSMTRIASMYTCGEGVVTMMKLLNGSLKQ